LLHSLRKFRLNTRLWQFLMALSLVAPPGGAKGRETEREVGREISGRLTLRPDALLITAENPYTGHFDLTGKWGDAPRVILTRLSVTFLFQDNDKWHRRERRGLPQKVNASRRFMTEGGNRAPRPAVEETYMQEVVVTYSNPEELARLRIGADMFFAASSRRRHERTLDRGEARSFMGLRDDPVSGERLALYQITQRRLREEWDGYADRFAIRRKMLSLAAMRDLTEDGILPFTLDGRGDYLLMEASLEYEGYALPGVAGEAEGQNILLHQTLPYGLVLGLSGMLGWGMRWLFKTKQSSKKRLSRVNCG